MALWRDTYVEDLSYRRDWLCPHAHQPSDRAFRRPSTGRACGCADTPALVPELRAAHYTRAWNLRHALDDLGVQKSYDDYHEMLEQEKIDIVICCAENAQHPAVVEACAQHGVHVIIEKPMAASLQDGLQMARTARAAGIELIVNWPTTWQPASHKAKEQIDSGRNRARADGQISGGPLRPRLDRASPIPAATRTTRLCRASCPALNGARHGGIRARRRGSCSTTAVTAHWWPAGWWASRQPA